jgi:hypothetical protein
VAILQRLAVPSISTFISTCSYWTGVFAVDGSVVDFHPVRRLTREDVAGVVALIARRVERLLERGLAGGAESGGAPDLWWEEAPVLAAAASVEGRVALGPRAGARVRRCGDPPEEVTPVALGACHAHVGGFDLHAGLVARAGQRDRLERLCRYALRAGRSPRTGCTLVPRGRSGSRCAAGGRTGRRTCVSICWSCWNGSSIDATAAGQPDSLLRRPGPARGVGGRAGPGGGLWCRCVTRGTRSRGRRGREPWLAGPVSCISMGRADASDVWVRQRPGVSAPRWAAAPGGAD